MARQKDGEQEKVWGAVEWVGRRLKELREVRGMTGEQLADKMGCKYSRVFDVESARNDIRSSTIFRFLDAMGVEFEHFAKTVPKRSEGWYSRETPAMKQELRERMKQNVIDAGNVRRKVARKVARKVTKKKKA